MDLGEESEPIVSSHGSHGDPSPSTGGKYKTVRSQNIIDPGTMDPPPQLADKKSNAKSDISEQDKAPSKRERLVEASQVRDPVKPLPIRTVNGKQDVPTTRAVCKPKKRVADLAEAEKAERLMKKSQRKQLRKIRGMEGHSDLTAPRHLQKPHAASPTSNTFKIPQSPDKK